jgi:hypothetical protein
MTHDFKPLACFLGHTLPIYYLLLLQISLRAPGLNAPRRLLPGAGTFSFGDQLFIAPGDKRAQAATRRSAGSPDSRKPVAWMRTKQVRQFIDHLAMVMGDENHLFDVSRGGRRLTEALPRVRRGVTGRAAASLETSVGCRSDADTPAAANPKPEIGKLDGRRMA